MQVFSGFSEQRLLFVAVHNLFIVVYSLVAEHGLSGVQASLVAAHGLSSYSAWT